MQHLILAILAFKKYRNFRFRQNYLKVSDNKFKGPALMGT